MPASAAGDNRVDTINSLDGLHADLARRHRAAESSGATVPAADLAALERDGYVILDNTGRNTFEGRLTQRVYSVLN
ncbi:hypothetical protein ACF1HJ_19795 [Streptomyces sp. NPDC013978]|uniref:hypothetical protein n=1 Tax=Streptomyces sp. NPDC013978 TaxID=3364869 RepID=UPI0036FD6AEA